MTLEIEFTSTPLSVKVPAESELLLIVLAVTLDESSSIAPTVWLPLTVILMPIVAVVVPEVNWPI